MSNDEYSVSMLKANFVSFLLFIPLSLLLLVPYGALWGLEKTGSDLIILYEDPLFFVFLMLMGIVAHELLHGLTWICVGNKSWSSIKFGVNFSALAPYAHCREPLEVNAYRWGAAMPGLLLGVVPFLAGLTTGHAWFTLFGYLLSITASGDILILWLIRNLERGTYVQDHPERAGCEVISAEN
ncbi:DUF3267 domain-containing protein [Halalkalibaculum sp. DA3122]|uniref:DUF3267 domain-containing protein n=1 Tax=unclassified Halalkalibaculum TaxID=2964617 RepID=UPI0037550908